MKIEHLTNTNPDYPKDSILRLFDFDSSEACLFKDVLSKLGHGTVSEIDLSEFPFVTPVHGCRLILKAGESDKGVVRLSSTVFECVLRRITWEETAGLVGPFCERKSSGYQWLYDLDTDIELLFSPNGNW